MSVQPAGTDIEGARAGVTAEASADILPFSSGLDIAFHAAPSPPDLIPL